MTRRRSRLFLQALEERSVPTVFVVSNNADSGTGSLRQALINANGSPGADTVDVTGVSGVIALAPAELTISDAVTIIGPGAGALTIKAGTNNRVFNTVNASSKSSISISGLTLTGGNPPGPGGAIDVSDEALTLNNCVLTGNTANGGGGGGAVYIYSGTGSLTLDGCTVSNNKASGANRGGGLSFRHGSSVIIRNSTVSGNSCGSVGGGIQFYYGGGLLLENSTVTGNSSGQAGGGMFLSGDNVLGGLTIRNCTIMGNVSGSSAGAIMLEGASTLVIQNSTITGNTANGGSGGAINETYHTCTIFIESSVVSGNINATAPDIAKYSYTSVNVKNSAIGSNKGFVLTDLGGNLPFGTNLKLGPLANNGGPTQTELPALDSPLLNAGSNPANLTTDQRGTGFARVANGKTDIGAVEVPLITLVTNTNDSGVGSLRQAILDSNALVGIAGIIQFDPAVFKSANTITLSGELPVTNGVAITGPGSGLLTVNGNKTGSVFDCNGGAGSLSISISGLTITGGSSPGPGGAIFDADEALTVSDCVITGNQSAQAGGGIYVQLAAGSLTLTRCTVSNNQVVAGVGQKAGDGGGIDLAANSTVVIDSCAVTGNTAKENGGGLYFFSGGSLTLTNSTISGNLAKSGDGGGIYFLGTATAFVVRNSTISGNTAQVTGGGVCLSNFAGTATIQNCTITNNTATSGTAGGIARISGGGSIALESSIVSGNSSPMSPDIDSAGSVTGKNSAIGSATGFTLTSQGGNLAFGTNLKLGPLAYNGGPLQTHLPLLGSPLINAGSNPATLTTDERGAGFFRNVMGQVDIGAVEVQDLVVTNSANSGPGTLRQAVIDANTLLPGSNTITFEPGFFGTPRTITLTTGEMAITDALTIQGPGSALVTVSGNSAGRVFSIDKSGSSATPIAISGLTITGGKSSAAGGGIFDADESLTLTNCVVTANQSSLTGGGIFVQSGLGSLTLQDCIVTNNQVTAGTGVMAGDGGAINLQGASQVVIDRSTVSGNSANDNGGGLYFFSGGSLTLTNSTLAGNTAKAQGGGIFFSGAVTGAGLTIRNSTISGNLAQSSGGGLCLTSFAGACVVQNATITNNTAQSFGGGIARTSGSGTVSLESSIVSGNINVNAPDIYSFTAVAAKFSAIGSNTGFTLNDQGGNLSFGVALNLGPLADNGGPTLTHALLAGSPCIDAGSNPAGLVTDQRGSPFVREFPAGMADIGALEVEPGVQVTSVQVNDGTAQRSRVTSLTVTFDQAVTLPATPANAFTLLRQSDSAVVMLNAAVAGNMVTLTFVGGPVESGSLADGRYTLKVLASQVNGGFLDGNGDGVAGDNYVLVGSPANGLFRLFGDIDGNGTVNNTDFLAFRSAFGGTSFAFDFNGNGSVDTNDFLAFRSRFGASV